MEQLVAEAGRSLGFERLKPQQMSAVWQFMEGNDVFVALPTGFGKSAIFGILPCAFDLKLNRTISIVLVVSPLTALMMEMKEKFVPRGMDAEFLGEIQEDTDLQVCSQGICVQSGFLGCSLKVMPFTFLWNIFLAD